MSTIIDSLSSKLQKALTKIGRSNGLAPPESQDPLNTLLHHYYVDDTAEKFFKKQKEKTLQRILDEDELVAARIEKAVADTKKLDVKQDVLLVDAPDYVLNLSTRKGSAKFDKDKLGPYLRKIGWTAVQVEALLAHCTGSNEPAKSFSVSLKTEQE